MPRSSTRAQVSTARSRAVGPARRTCPAIRADLNPQYFTEYPEDIKIFALTFDTKFKRRRLFRRTELSTEPAPAVQLAGPDRGLHVADGADAAARQANAARAGSSLPRLGATRCNAVPAGGHCDAAARAGRRRHEPRRRGRLQDHSGSSGSVGGALRPLRRVRAGAGQWRVSRRRPIPSPCSYDGYVSQNAFGYRLRAGLRYPEVIAGRCADSLGLLRPRRVRLVREMARSSKAGCSRSPRCRPSSPVDGALRLPGNRPGAAPTTTCAIAASAQAYVGYQF